MADLSDLLEGDPWASSGMECQCGEDKEKGTRKEKEKPACIANRILPIPKAQSHWMS